MFKTLWINLPKTFKYINLHKIILVMKVVYLYTKHVISVIFESFILLKNICPNVFFILAIKTSILISTTTHVVTSTLTFYWDMVVIIIYFIIFIILIFISWQLFQDRPGDRFTEVKACRHGHNEEIFILAVTCVLIRETLQWFQVSIFCRIFKYILYIKTLNIGNVHLCNTNTVWNHLCTFHINIIFYNFLIYYR